MTTIYYVEVNLICLIVLMLIEHHLNDKIEKFSTDMIIFNRLVFVAMILCFSDMIAGITRGEIFYGSKVIVELSNMVFFEALSVISYLWMMYVAARLKLTKGILWTIPLWLITIIVLSNPFTNILFYINSANIYSRNLGVVFHWIVTWFYLIVPTIEILIISIRDKNKYKRQEALPMLAFVIPPFFASIVQMLLYGVSSSQVGITISVLIILLATQRRQIVTDALTGINNRHGLDNFMQNFFATASHIAQTDIAVLLLDINDFKKINDTFGHLAGDSALKAIAGQLKKLCNELESSAFLCRYGGDEFMIVMYDYSIYEVENLTEQLKKGFEEVTLGENIKCNLSLSIGMTKGRCLSLSNIERLIAEADKLMYADKLSLKKLM